MALRNPRGTDKGFSLIELIVVLVIIGLAAAVTAPFIFWTLERVEIRSAVKEIASSLRYARSVAISEKKEMRFYMDLDERLYWLDTRREEGREDGENRDPGQEEQGTSPPAYPTAKRSLNSLVNVDLFVRGEDEFDEGTVMVSFSPFGSSSGGQFNLKTHEESSRPLYFTVKVDPVTVRVKTKEMDEEP